MDEELLQEEDTQKDKYLTFTLGEELYGIDIRVVIEIIGILPITKVPEVPDYVRGIINLRGKIIPVIDMRLRFGREFRPYTDPGWRCFPFRKDCLQIRYSPGRYF